MNIKFKTKGQSLIRCDDNIIAANGQKYLTAEFETDSLWDEYTVTACFTKRQTAYHVILDGNKCTVPFEVLGVGEFFVSLIGVHIEDAGDRITTEKVGVKVKTGPELEAENASEPTATEMEQVLTYLGQARESATNAETFAADLKRKADNGEFDGEDGKDGNDGKDGDDGATFTPTVDAEGNLSWTNDKGLENPEPTNITGPQGKPGHSGVYVGTGDMPDGYNVQVDPEGEFIPLSDLNSVAVSSKQPDGKNVKLWVEIESYGSEEDNAEQIPIDYAKNLTWIYGERWIATSGNIETSYADTHRTEGYINVEADEVYRITGIFADPTLFDTFTADYSLGVFKDDSDTRTKGLVRTSNFAVWSEDHSYVDVTVPASSKRLYLNAIKYAEGTDIKAYVKVYKIINGEIECEVGSSNTTTATVSVKPVLKFKNTKGEYQNVIPASRWSKQYRYQYRVTDEESADYNEKKIVDTLPFWLCEPHNPTKNKLPLIVVLHSAHFKINPAFGNGDNLNEMVDSMIFDDFTKYIYQGEFGELPAYIVMPQIANDPAGTRWSIHGAEIANLVTACKQKYSGQIGEVCLIGYSLGGRGAWELASAYPSIFSRVLTVAGDLDGVGNNNIPYDPVTGTEITSEDRIGDVAEALTAAETKVWCIVGEKDSEVKPDTSISLCEKIPTAECTVIADGSHSKALEACLTYRSKVIEFLAK